MISFSKGAAGRPGLSDFPLTAYSLNFSLDKIVPGVDNVRYDVYLSPSFCQAADRIIPQLIAKNIQLNEFFKIDAPGVWAKKVSEFKRLYRLIIKDAINKSKLEKNPQVDYLAQTAVIKMLIAEIRNQLDNTTSKIKNIIRKHEVTTGQKTGGASKTKESLSNVLQNKDALLRRVGNELFTLLNEVSADELKTIREANFGAEKLLPDNILDNPLFHTLNPYHDTLLIEEYDVIFGRRIEDPDNYDKLIELLGNLLQTLKGRDKTIKDSTEGNPDEIDKKAAEDSIDSYLKQVDNIDILLNFFNTKDNIKKFKKQKAEKDDIAYLKNLSIKQKSILKEFYKAFKKAKLAEKISASYEMRPVYYLYCPPLVPQQILLFMIEAKSRKAVMTRLKQLKKVYHQSYSLKPLKKQIKKLELLQVKDKKKYIVRYLNGIVRYHRDIENFKILNEAMESINLTSDEETLNLSRANNTLYEFLLPSEKTEDEKPIINHVIIKADVRGSTDITYQMNKRGLNPASYFSLNFFNPISEILNEYGAVKVFIEGDAMILSIFEREKTPEGWYGVARACGIAINMLIIIKRYNEKSKKNRLPILELGIGVNYLHSPPTFLFDGNQRIMISSAINLADRQSSCSKAIRNFLSKQKPAFNLSVFQTETEEEMRKTSDDIFVRYNVNGIELNSEGFKKLSKEIKLIPIEADLPEIKQKKVKLYTGKFPLTSGRFQRLIIREANIHQINPDTFQHIRVTPRKYYEVCTHPTVYQYVRDRVK